MLFDISLTITYEYDYPAEASRQIVRLTPADLPGEQRLIASSTSITPKPDEWINRKDFFGNNCVELAIVSQHKTIVFVMQARVERLQATPLLDISPHPSVLSGELEMDRDLGPLAPHHYAGASARVPLDDDVAAYARTQAAGAQTTVEAMQAIGQALNRDFRYDATATEVETPMRQAFEARSGVCQDFSHIMIAALRGLGIPAGYVSGFLRTVPPPGKPRLEGADAMHAWVMAWCGREAGWVEYDPTNATFVSQDHIVVARGRDYSDVAPVKGVMRTYGAHETDQAVDVIAVET